MFKEIDSQDTPLGIISLRLRTEPRLNNKELYEVKLGEEFLMSSLFTEAEEQLSKLGLAALNQPEISVVVGGLGLGYTAVTALEDPRVTELQVVDVMAPVIRWHQEELVPLGKTLSDDQRCQLVHGDFFALPLKQGHAYDGTENKQVDAVLLDIDHSPSRWLNLGNSEFYSKRGLEGIADKLVDGGVFGLWSDDLPDQAFIDLLDSVFEKTEAHIIEFENPYTGNNASNSVYLSFKRPS